MRMKSSQQNPERLQEVGVEQQALVNEGEDLAEKACGINGETGRTRRASENH